MDEALRREEFDLIRSNYGWYTDGQHFVIVYNDMYYDEFSIGIQEVKDVLEDEFLKKLAVFIF